MKPFEQWIKEPPGKAPPPAIDMLAAADQLEAEGLDLLNDGTVWGQCCMCEAPIRWTDYLSLAEILKDGVGAEYCGGSPRCCP
jgi:hypothetical protein